MILLVERQVKLFTAKTSPGDLFVDGKLECVTLEDTYRKPGEPKVFGHTAIPEGTYEVIWRYSPAFKMWMPELRDIPGFKYVYFHAGNKEEETDGCILVGRTRSPDWVGESQLAWGRLRYKLLMAFSKNESIVCTVRNKS